MFPLLPLSLVVVDMMHMAGFSFKGNINSIKYELLNQCEEAVLKNELPTIENDEKILNILNSEDKQK